MKEDCVLIKGLNGSSKESFAALYDKYAGMVYNFACSILKDASLCEDITQSCFVSLWTRRKEISPDGNVPAWLYVTARNAVYKEIRRQVTAARYADYVTCRSELSEEPCGDIDIETVRREAEAAIDALPSSRRKIYMMRYIDGLTVKQIGMTLGISEKTVETQIARAKHSLRKRISELLMLAILLNLEQVL